MKIERLHAAGFAPAEAASRAGLVAEVVSAFTQAAGSPPRWGWFVPGRIEVFGKHTDYAGGRSLVAAVPRGFVVVASPRADRIVRVLDARWRDTAEVHLDDLAARFTGWSNYIAVVVRRLNQNFPGADLGADIAVLSDLPRAAGLSSSSALVVAVATALVRRGALDDRPEWRQTITSTLDLAGYLGAVENGLTFGSLPGTSGVGTHGGSEDHTAILTGRADRLSAYSYVPVRHLGDEPMPEAWRFVVAGSGIQADKAGSAKDRYNRASLGTRALLDVWNTTVGTSWPTLAAALASGPGVLDALRELTRATGFGDFTPKDLQIRLRHFIAEDARVPQAATAFRDADVAAVGELSALSQAEADALLGNQTPETRTLARLAREVGAFAASSFGAGFGGSVWALAPADEAQAFATRWLSAYRAAFPALNRADVFVTRPGPGVVDLALSE
ncbi:MAG: galactokinase [Vicinamibacterales bacterium]